MLLISFSMALAQFLLDSWLARLPQDGLGHLRAPTVVRAEEEHARGRLAGRNQRILCLRLRGTLVFSQRGVQGPSGLSKQRLHLEQIQAVINGAAIGGAVPV